MIDWVKHIMPYISGMEPRSVLFIDEIHTMVGAGNASGSLDASNILKPALARGEIQCIGATTLDEYRENIEKDGALERRFQKVMVDPSSVAETIQILKNIRDKYESFHKVTYTDEVIETCVKLSDTESWIFLHDSELPETAMAVAQSCNKFPQLIDLGKFGDQCWLIKYSSLTS